jgi:hypothetical protein
MTSYSKLKATLAAAFLFVAVSTPGWAALSVTDSELGLDTIVQDSATGLDWLALSFTQGFSVDQVLAATAPGGTLEDFRLATRDELVTLITALGIPQTGTCFGACFTEGERFVAFFRSNAGLLAPVTEVEPGLVELFAFRISLFPETVEAFGDLQLITRLSSVAFPADAFFLVAEGGPPTQIPEPGALGLLGSALVAGAMALHARLRGTSPVYILTRLDPEDMGGVHARPIRAGRSAAVVGGRR